MKTSSSQVRDILGKSDEFYDHKRVAAASTSLDELLPKTVQKYISENHLYHSEIKTADGRLFKILPSFDEATVKWKSGQIIGFSSRAGGSPFIVQVASRSPLDHVGIVSVEDDQKYVYEFTNNLGVSKTPLKECLENARGKSGHIMAAVSELDKPLTEQQLKKMFEYCDHMITIQPEYGIAKIPNGPRSCSQYVQGAFKSIGVDLGKTENISEFNTAAFNGFIDKYWKVILKDTETLVSPKSFFEGKVHTVASNLPHGISWSDEEALLTWKLDGDFSKVARMTAIDSGVSLKGPEQIEARSAQLVQELERASTPIEVNAKKCTFLGTMKLLFAKKQYR